MLKIKTDDIIIVDATDAFRGKVVAPGIVRYYDEKNDVYEVNVLLPAGEGCAHEGDICWWAITADEISAVVGHAEVEYALQGTCALPGSLRRAEHRALPVVGGDKMKFMVGYDADEKPPFEGAKRELYVHVDERTVDDPTKVPESGGGSGWWYAEGQDHRVEDGHIKRDFFRSGWFIELVTLEDLVSLIREHGWLAFGPSFVNPGIIRIFEED